MNKAKSKSKKVSKKSVKKAKKTFGNENKLSNDFWEDCDELYPAVCGDEDYQWVEPSEQITPEELPKAQKAEIKKPWWRFW